MNIGNRMKERRKQLKLSADEVAEKIGVSRSNVYRYEKGDIEKLPLEVLEPLSEILRTTPQFLMGWEEDYDILSIYNNLETSRKAKVYSYAKQQLEEQNKVVSMEEYKTIKIHSSLSAGTGIIDLDPEDTEEINYAGDVPEHDMAFRVSGDSMTPLFENGEIIFVKRTEDVRNGQVIAVQINEEAYIKKTYIENDCLRLVSLNKEYDDIIADDNDDIRIVGKVIL